MTTTWQHLNETPLERELRFLDRHILRLEVLQGHYEALDYELEDDEDPPDEDRRHWIYVRQADLEVELVLLEACYDRKRRLENEQNAVNALNALTGERDPESDHFEADGILLGMISPSISDAYKQLATRSRWWACA